MAFEGFNSRVKVSDPSVEMTENITGNIVSNECHSTSVKIALEADQMSLQGGCTNRHVFGVDEKVNTRVWPMNTIIEWRDGVDIDVCLDGRSFYCPWTGGSYSPVIECGTEQFNTSITVVEPQVVCPIAEWDGVVGMNGSKVWCIPVGWGQPGVLKGRITPDPTTQRFELTEAGVVTVEKYQHVIMRDTANGVWLDGEREN